MRFSTLFFVIPLAILTALFALENSQEISLSFGVFYPEPLQTTLAVALLVFAVSTFLIGWFCGWFNAGTTRQALRKSKKDLKAANKELLELKDSLDELKSKIPEDPSESSKKPKLKKLASIFTK